ncbi:hypothetical protein B9Z55_023142 [Caenorhabditis nigoni]|uniref:Uncharacterized protein n=1 Tax=Caenorhabditis nigoni TaxID=1611254 RepID=A0A2G5SN73_9PELO|nr:hypothetical protein B9Z55_023142 [Caenorhabditis nigoni]
MMLLRQFVVVLPMLEAQRNEYAQPSVDRNCAGMVISVREASGEVVLWCSSFSSRLSFRKNGDLLPTFDSFDVLYLKNNGMSTGRFEKRTISSSLDRILFHFQHNDVRFCADATSTFDNAWEEIS